MVMLARLRHIRERKALTQEELAEKAQITRTALARLETGKASARPTTVRKLAAALDVEPEDLIGPEE